MYAGETLLEDRLSELWCKYGLQKCAGSSAGGAAARPLPGSEQGGGAATDAPAPLGPPPSDLQLPLLTQEKSGQQLVVEVPPAALPQPSVQPGGGTPTGDSSTHQWSGQWRELQGAGGAAGAAVQLPFFLSPVWSWELAQARILAENVHGGGEGSIGPESAGGGSSSGSGGSSSGPALDTAQEPQGPPQATVTATVNPGEEVQSQPTAAAGAETGAEVAVGQPAQASTHWAAHVWGLLIAAKLVMALAVLGLHRCYRAWRQPSRVATSQLDAALLLEQGLPRGECNAQAMLGDGQLAGPAQQPGQSHAAVSSKGGDPMCSLEQPHLLWTAEQSAAAGSPAEQQQQAAEAR